MRFRVVDAGTPEGLRAWTERWRAWPAREVMAHPEYARLFARPCDRVVAAIGEDAGGSVLFPLIVRPLAAEPWAGPGERRWDATSPYGYGGPFAWGGHPRDDAAFWRAYAGWCEEERIVSTFARLSLFPEELAFIPRGVEELAPNVVIGLSEGVEALWRGYEPKVRRWVATAERAGLDVDVDEDGRRLDTFLGVYERTMDRHRADAWYYFPRTFFEAIVERLHGQFAFFSTLSGGEVVSSDLVLLSAERVYYFLGGTLEHAFPLGPNYLLKHRIAVWALEHGKRSCVLGGGYQPHDGLLRYKRAFTRGAVVPFRVARLTHDEAACRELTALRASSAAPGAEAWKPRDGYFPPYRG